MSPSLSTEFLHTVNDYVIGSDDPLFKMTCEIHYNLKLVDGKPLAAIWFTVSIENGEMVLGGPVFVDRDLVSRRLQASLQVMYDQQLLSLTEALFCAAATTI
ncbi:hypothetical protein B0H13DRAFT_1858786 [Mycena leptocephala]|nr:hypothetical protein B0H13DRAFT_1858786 [Mycena leptocephala]